MSLIQIFISNPTPYLNGFLLGGKSLPSSVHQGPDVLFLHPTCTQFLFSFLHKGFLFPILVQGHLLSLSKPVLKLFGLEREAIDKNVQLKGTTIVIFGTVSKYEGHPIFRPCDFLRVNVFVLFVCCFLTRRTISINKKN